jgi:predicted nucleic acid-binding protein
MIVADTNMIAYLVIPGQMTSLAEAARARDGDWRAPSLFASEWLNVVATHLRAGIFDRDEALRVYRRGLSMVMAHATRPDPVHVLNLTAQSGCTSYDCEFVALADDLGVPLVTADQKVVVAFPRSVVGLREFAGGK